MRRPSLALLLSIASVAAFGAAGCADEAAEDAEASDSAFSSREAVQLDFELDGELVTDSSWGAQQKIQDQFLYTIGHLNHDRSVGRLDRLVLTNVQTAAQGDGTYRVTYHAKIPVAWGKKASVPTSYAFALPKTITFSGLEAFTTKYMNRCVDISAHDVDSGSMWYYYRPNRAGCSIDAADVVRFNATVSRSVENTTGKYPEYHKVWEDNELRVVAIFGKNEDGATANDAGISAYDSFVASMRSTLGALSLTTEPANLPTNPGIASPDATFRATLADGKKVTVTALLVDNVRTAGPSFDARYEQLSTSADVIIYNGHAGLGQNVRALANKGRFVSGKYLLLFMNGCDTFAYVDGSLAQKRAAINPDDPGGTKYMDIVTNAMPSYFHANSRASTALVRGLMSIAQPQTFEQMFTSIDTQQVVLVTGEEDNVFRPGMPIGGAGGLYSREESGAVTRGEENLFDTPELPAGKYTVSLTHDPAAPGGDADLYVKVGAAPTSTVYDCRPYIGGSNEECSVTLAAPAKIYAKVVGYATRSNAYKLSIKQLAAPAPGAWAGMNESGTVARNEEKRFQTTELPAGSYTFAITGTGDADLYVKRGAAPTSTVYDCRPFKSGSSETCTVNLTEPATVHVMVRGYAASSQFELTGRQ
ncbi:MAG: PPC domain-containing protein [Labilithrix sp.]|nr:PPC domain-containing protein [Labilithrix sp.]